MIKKLSAKTNDIVNIKFGDNKENLLHIACETGNIELVKYLISLNKIDITSKTIFIYFL